MPAMVLDGTGVAGYATFRDHCGYFPLSGKVLEAAGDAVAGYRHSKGGIRFGFDERLPVALVRRLVELRLAELATRWTTARGASTTATAGSRRWGRCSRASSTVPGGGIAATARCCAPVASPTGRRSAPGPRGTTTATPPRSRRCPPDDGDLRGSIPFGVQRSGGNAVGHAPRARAGLFTFGKHPGKPRALASVVGANVDIREGDLNE